MKRVEKVFIIDDDSVFLYSLKKLISNLQFAKEITVFSDAEEAIIYLEDHLDSADKMPDAIFLDINMPMMTGWEFLADYQQIDIQSSKKIDLYVVSSSINTADIERVQTYSYVADYITKPVTSQVLTNILERQKAI